MYTSAIAMKCGAGFSLQSYPYMSPDRRGSCADSIGRERRTRSVPIGKQDFLPRASILIPSS